MPNRRRHADREHEGADDECLLKGYGRSGVHQRKRSRDSDSDCEADPTTIEQDRPWQASRLHWTTRLLERAGNAPPRMILGKTRKLFKLF